MVYIYVHTLYEHDVYVNRTFSKLCPFGRRIRIKNTITTAVHKYQKKSTFNSVRGTIDRSRVYEIRVSERFRLLVSLRQ